MTCLQKGARPAVLAFGLLVGAVAVVPGLLHAQESVPSPKPFSLYEQSPRYVTKTWLIDDGLP